MINQQELYKKLNPCHPGPYFGGGEPFIGCGGWHVYTRCLKCHSEHLVELTQDEADEYDWVRDLL